MDFIQLILKNIINLPILCFFIGILINFFGFSLKFPKKIYQSLTFFILFCIGLKGGGPLVEYSTSNLYFFLIVLSLLVAWGFLQPILSFFLLKAFTKVDRMTAAAIAASFGSISVMTFIKAVAFLEQFQISYQGWIISTLAIMEIPGIISGMFLAKAFEEPKKIFSSIPFSKILRESLWNKAVLTIVLGLLFGALAYKSKLSQVSSSLLILFQPALCLFLLDMGFIVGLHKNQFKSFSWNLSLFGLYMPLLGGGMGLLISYALHLDPGTATLVAVLLASASYIAVPAAFRVSLPEAKEAVYLPLSLGITFPFNVIVGIPLYHQLALWLLS